VILGTALVGRVFPVMGHSRHVHRGHVHVRHVHGGHVVVHGDVQGAAGWSVGRAQHEPARAGHEARRDQGAREERHQQQSRQYRVSSPLDRQSILHALQLNGVAAVTPWAVLGSSTQERFDANAKVANASQCLNSRNAASTGAETAGISGEEGDTGMGRKGTLQREFSVGTGVGTSIRNRKSGFQIKYLAADEDASLSPANPAAQSQTWVEAFRTGAAHFDGLAAWGGNLMDLVEVAWESSVPVRVQVGANGVTL